MSYNLAYKGQFTNIQTDSSNNDDGKLITIWIYDTASGAAGSPSSIIPLEMADQPCSISTIDNDEDKFTAIRSKQAVINIHSSTSIGIETFADGGDERFYGEIYVGAQVKLKGFLSVADLQEKFLPDPNIISLVLTDGLKLLSGIDLTGMTNEQTILDIVQACLANTGMSLDLMVSMNVREVSAVSLNDDTDGSGHFFKFISLDIKTFEKQIGTLEDCLTILSKIMNIGLNLTQFNGRWLIYLVDEFKQSYLRRFFIWDSGGNFVSKGAAEYTKFIGISSPMIWMDEDCLITNDQANKTVQITFPYEFPDEIPCNSDFSRGTGSDPTGAANETIDYVPDCWDFLREGTTPAGLDSPAFSGSIGVLRKRFELFYEKDRYFAAETAGGFRHYFKSEAIKVQTNDKISFSVNFRHAVDDGSVTSNVAHIRLVGDDGFLYDWDYEVVGSTNSWVKKVATDTVFDSTMQQNVTGVDMSQWQSLSATSLPLPVGGLLYIRLLDDLAPPVVRHFSGLSVSIVQFVNGSYQKYSSQQHIVTQLVYKATIDQQVSISDAPHISMKGCLLKRGVDREIFNGVVGFSGVANEFDTSGDKRAIFKAGMKIIITGSVSNNQTATITSVNYAIFTDLTQVFINGTTVSETGVTVSIKVPSYVLTQGFYDAAAFPAADYPDSSYVKPYGEMQSFWLFNQRNRVMRNFDGTIDGLEMSDSLETNNGMPDLFYGFILSDPNANSSSRYLQLLHFEMDLNLAQWNGFLSEVNSTIVDKIYTGHSFKYLTK